MKLETADVTEGLYRKNAKNATKIHIIVDSLLKIQQLLRTRISPCIMPIMHKPMWTSNIFIT